ncbi:MAG: hypothetical protein ACRD0O_14705, partial [Acidimicrobiia bacterium]
RIQGRKRFRRSERLGALTADPHPEGPLNVASGEPRSVLDMASTLAEAFGPDAPAPVVTGECRLGDVRHVVASPGRARAVLGFRAMIPFSQGMAEFARAPLRAKVGRRGGVGRRG